jgi:beta-glucanase (GH16 family)
MKPATPRIVLGALLAAITLAAAAAAHAQSASPQLVWDDEFNGPVGSGPDPTKWVYDLGVGNPAGWGNNELETYTNSRNNSLIVSDPAATDGKALAIRAQYTNGTYTSARINTSTTFNFTYGRIEARASMPTGIGCWPAFWALGSDITTVSWPACGEIDVMEWVGQTPGTIYGSLHATGYSGASALTASTTLPGNAVFSGAYHVFAVDWYPGEIVFSADGAVYEVRQQSAIPAGSSWPFNQNFFILLNFAIGGNWPGSPNAQTVFPQDYRVDYVRAYSLPSTPPPNLVWPPSPPSNVSAYFSAASQVNVMWQAPFSTFGAAISGYVLQRANDPAFTQGLTSWSLGNTTSFSDTSAVAGGTYYYRLSAVSPNGTSASSAGVQASALVAAADSKLLNISTRGFVGTGADVLIAGFYVSGSTPKTVLIRASGPALAAEPFNIPGVLPDPELQVYSGSSVIASNTGWGGSARIVAAASAAGAFTWSDPKSADSALLLTLPPGPYTAIVSGTSGDTGVSLVEVYDPNSPGEASKLTNISTRGFVGTGADVLIAGFYIGGEATKTVLVRASGPALAPEPFDVSGVLPDPELQVYNSSSEVIASNSAWDGSPEMAAAASTVGAFSWESAPTNDSALLLTLPPGQYTAIVSGGNADTGVALVEVYEVP